VGEKWAFGAAMTQASKQFAQWRHQNNGLTESPTQKFRARKARAQPGQVQPTSLADQSESMSSKNPSHAVLPPVAYVPPQMKTLLKRIRAIFYDLDVLEQIEWEKSHGLDHVLSFEEIQIQQRRIILDALQTLQNVATYKNLNIRISHN
jgi:hypothetical protein